MRWGRHRTPGRRGWEEDARQRKVKDRAALRDDLETELYGSRWRPRKNRKRWCKGRRGREHELVVEPERGDWPVHKYRCRTCGRVTDRYYSRFSGPKPEWFLAWEREHGAEPR